MVPLTESSYDPLPECCVSLELSKVYPAYKKCLDTYSNSGVFSSPRSPAIPSPLVSSPQPSTQSYLSTSPALLSPMLSARTPPPPPVSQPLSQSYLSTSPPLLSPILSARTPPPPPPVHMSLGSPPRISSPTVITSRPTHSKGSQPEQTK